MSDHIPGSIPRACDCTYRGHLAAKPQVIDKDGRKFVSARMGVNIAAPNVPREEQDELSEWVDVAAARLREGRDRRRLRQRHQEALPAPKRRDGRRPNDHRRLRPRRRREHRPCRGQARGQRQAGTGPEPGPAAGVKTVQRTPEADSVARSSARITHPQRHAHTTFGSRNRARAAPRAQVPERRLARSSACRRRGDAPRARSSAGRRASPTPPRTPIQRSRHCRTGRTGSRPPEKRSCMCTGHGSRPTPATFRSCTSGRRRGAGIGPPTGAVEPRELPGGGRQGERRRRLADRRQR